MPRTRFPYFIYCAIFSIACGGITGCKPSASHEVLPYHDDALLHASRPPYQPTTSAQRGGNDASKAGRSKPADKPPSKSRRATSAPEHVTPRTDHGGVVPTTTDSSASRIRNADGYTPRHAVSYVAHTYALNGVEFENADRLRIVDLYRSVQKAGTIYHSKKPVAGDLVFFHNTYDANGDRRNNDWYVHVGVIETVDKDGTITFLSYRDKQVKRDRMNLHHPHEETLDGATINSSLRTAQKGDPAYTQYLAGELFAGFGAVLGDVDQVMVVDTWSP